MSAINAETLLLSLKRNRLLHLLPRSIKTMLLANRGLACPQCLYSNYYHRQILKLPLAGFIQGTLIYIALILVPFPPL